MTDKELLEKTAKRLRVIADDTQRITSGNMSHNLTCIRGFALRAAESIERHLQEPVSEELEKFAYQSGYAAYSVDMAEEFGGVIRDNNRYQRSSYIKGLKAGAQWQKQQMMKGSIDTTIKQGCTDLGVFIKGLDEDKFSFGDKVKVSVIKKG